MTEESFSVGVYQVKYLFNFEDRTDRMGQFIKRADIDRISEIHKAEIIVLW